MLNKQRKPNDADRVEKGRSYDPVTCRGFQGAAGVQSFINAEQDKCGDEDRQDATKTVVPFLSQAALYGEFQVGSRCFSGWSPYASRVPLREPCSNADEQPQPCSEKHSP